MADQHKVLKNADGRVVDFAFGPVGFTTPQRLNDKLAGLPAGASIETYAGDLPTNIREGYAIDDMGVVSVPTTETTNERLEARKDKVEQWVLANIPTRDFAAYGQFVSPEKAAAFEAIVRRTYYSTLIDSILADDAQWGRLNAHTGIDWLSFDLLVDIAHWPESLRTSLRAGTAWRNIGTDGMGRYVPETEMGAENWPATYVHETHFLREYTELLARTRVA